MTRFSGAGGQELQATLRVGEDGRRRRDHLFDLPHLGRHDLLGFGLHGPQREEDCEELANVDAARPRSVPRLPMLFLGVGRSTGRGAVPDNGVGSLVEPSGVAAICEDGQLDVIAGWLLVAGVDSGLDGLLGILSVALYEDDALKGAHCV